jgi:excisionase family DNA binding protein
VLLLDLTEAERLHLAAALRDRQRALRRDGRTLPPRLTELAAGLIGPQAATAGRKSPTPATTTKVGDAWLMSGSQAARLLGVSDRTLRRRAAAGDIPSVLDGNHRRYRRTDLERYVKQLPPGRQHREHTG